MFDDPNEPPAERSINPADRAREKFDEFRMHAEIAAVFEAARKFDAQVVANLDAEIARDLQRTIGRLEKSKAAEHPILTEPSAVADAARVLRLPETAALSTNDYHAHRRPGEAMLVRFLAGDEVATFYDRFQAHFDAALHQFREEERQSLGWKQDPETTAYIDALDKIDVRMADRYLRDPIKQHKLFVLSTQAADEMDILHLCDFVMGVEAAAVVGRASAPPEDGATERDRAWFLKLFSVRGFVDGVERMCFFTFLQKADESAW